MAFDKRGHLKKMMKGAGATGRDVAEKAQKMGSSIGKNVRSASSNVAGTIRDRASTIGQRPGSTGRPASKKLKGAMRKAMGRNR